MTEVRPRRLGYIKRFVSLGSAAQLRLALAWALLGFTRLCIIALPFGWICSALKLAPDGPAAASDEAPRVGRQRSDGVLKAQEIGRLTALAARHTPWRSECYPQALAVRIQLVLARIPHEMRFGVRRNSRGELVAHAWVRSADVPIVGGDSRDYTVVGSFTWPPTAVAGRET